MSNKNKKVLVLNSDETFLRVFRNALENEGFEVVTGRLPKLIEQGKQYLIDFIREQEPAVIVWDINYPYERYWKYYKNVRSMGDFSEIYFIPVTTGGRLIKKKYSKDTEVLAVIDKPFDMVEMIDTLRTGIKLGKLAKTNKKAS